MSNRMWHITALLPAGKRSTDVLMATSEISARMRAYERYPHALKIEVVEC